MKTVAACSWRQRALAQQVGKRPAAQQPHGNVSELVFDEPVGVNWQDVDVFEQGNDRRFLLEALAEFFTLFLIGAQVDNF